MVGPGPAMNPTIEPEAVLPNIFENLNLLGVTIDDEEAVLQRNFENMTLSADDGLRVEDAGVLAQFEAENGNGFYLLRARPISAQLERLPRGLRVVLWNCRGVGNKQHLPGHLLVESGADLLILN